MPAGRILFKSSTVWGLAAFVCLWAAVTAQPIWAREAGLADAREDAEGSNRVESLEALADKIESDLSREQLVRDIRALIALQKQASQPAPEKPLSERLAETASRTIEDTSRSLKDVRRFFHNRGALTDWLTQRLSDPAYFSRMADQARPVVLIFGIAWLVEFISVRLLARAGRRLEARMQQAAAGRLRMMGGWVILSLAGVAAFTAAWIAAFLFMQPGGNLEKVPLKAFVAYIAGRTFLIAARSVLTPPAAAMGLLPIRPQAAGSLFAWIRRMVLVGLAGYLASVLLLLFGLPPRGYAALMNLLGMILVLMVVVSILHRRALVADWIRGIAEASCGEHAFSRSVCRGLAAVWHLLTIFYLVALFVIWWQSIPGGLIYLLRGTLLTAFILWLSWLSLKALRRWVERKFSGEEDVLRRFSGIRERAGVYLPILLNLARTIVVFAAALLILETWKVEAYQWLKTTAVQRMLSVCSSIALVLGIAVVVWEVVNAAVNRYLIESERSGRIPTQGARVRTLLPLMRKALLLVLSVLVALVVLSELGIHIGPLLAGAGIVGLAVGFGAQKLVQDLITGIFILIEDAVAVGDVVQVAGIGGLVEDLSIRSIRLRDLSGNVHTIPFSAVETVTNMTKGYSYYLIDIGVAYREDTDRVAEVCKQIVDEMRSDPEQGQDILEPLEVLGVDRFADSAVIIKARIKTRPIKQWAVGREFNRRMKIRFDELGIEIPFPHRTVYFGAVPDGGPTIALNRSARHERSGEDSTGHY